MGKEYRATFASQPDRDALDTTLRARHRFTGFERQFASYQFRHPSNPSAMPNVEVRIVFDEPERVVGLYVCDYGDDGTILADLVSALDLTLEEIE